jgi:hypothetical protein
VVLLCMMSGGDLRLCCLSCTSVLRYASKTAAVWFSSARTHTGAILVDDDERELT